MAARPRRRWLRIALAVLAALIVLGAGALWWVTRPDVARYSTAELSGRVPLIAGARPETIPTVAIAKVVGWPADAAPRAAPGLAVSRFADGLDNPRTILPLPNGDVLVAESAAPPSRETGVTATIAKWLMARAGADKVSANRITLLRDADGDGRAEGRFAYITGLSSPYGMVLNDGTLFIAATDALMAYPYDPAATRITAPGRRIAALPASGTNRHWTKSLALSPDGTTLLVGVGANSNIAEFGLETEQDRARILEITIATGAVRTFSAGLRNPVGIAVEPTSRDVYTVVNERDQLGSDLVPDYLTRVRFGTFYGWPWYYWGGFVDSRVAPQVEDQRDYVARPDYALGSHVAPLGLSFGDGRALAPPFGKGAYVALHGSWNRVPVSGYSVVHVPFDDRGRPADVLPVTLLSGFTDPAGKVAYGRPADVQVARDGALLVADDGGNIIWRVTRAGAPGVR